MMDQAYARKLLDHAFGVATLTVTTPVRLRLMTANGSNTANGTELATGSGYTQGVGAPSNAHAAATAAQPSVSANSGTTSISNMPACSLTGIEEWESNVTTPMRIHQAAYTGGTKTINLGDTLSHAAGSVSLALTQ